CCRTLWSPNRGGPAAGGADCAQPQEGAGADGEGDGCDAEGGHRAPPEAGRVSAGGVTGSAGGVMGRAPNTQLKLIPRDRCIREFWEYKAGDHVSFIGPTGSGKPYLASPLLARSVSEELPGFMLVMKRRDKTVTDFLEKYNWRRTTTYPIPPTMRKKPLGWAIWPQDRK